MEMLWNQSLQRGYSDGYRMSYHVMSLENRIKNYTNQTNQQIIFRCPSWRNKAGVRVTGTSTCLAKGTWSTPKAFPPGPLFFPHTLNKPDSGDMPCGCRPLNITYNPNLEKGTEFFCDPPCSLSQANLPARIDTNTQCHLLCDKMLVAVIECKQSMWSGQPDLGFWCNQENKPIGSWIE